MVNRKRTCTRCARNTMQGGGLGNGYHLGTEMLARGYAAVEPYSSCGALSRPGMMSTDMTSTMNKGLPGLAGGGRKRRGNKRTQRKRKAQRGGRYDMVMAGAEFEALGPRGGMMATAMRSSCEAGQGTPLPSPTTITAPPFKGGAQLAPAPFLQEQTAGYTQMSSKWLDSVGAPIQLHTPVGGRMGTPACGQTGGKRSGSKKQRGGDKACDDAKTALSNAQQQLQVALFNKDEKCEDVMSNGENSEKENDNLPPPGAMNIAGGSRRKNRKASRKQRKASRKNRKASHRSASRRNRK